MLRVRGSKEGAHPPSLALWLLLAAATASASAIRVHVIGVYDGDTINVTDSRHRLHRVRIAAIDAPEMDQPFGVQSKRRLRRMLLNRDAELHVYTHDIYGRDVASILVDGNDAGLTQIRAGLAWHYTAYDHERSAADRAAYVSAETDARDARRGLWSLHKPVAPWLFREARKAAE